MPRSGTGAAGMTQVPSESWNAQAGRSVLDVIDRQHVELAFCLERVEAHTNSAANSRAETIRVAR